MAKNYAKFVPPKYRTSRRKPWRAEVVIAVCLLMLGTLAFGGFLYVERTQGTVASSQRISAFLTKVATLIQHKKTSPAIDKPAAATRQLANARPGPEPVRFDFYNALPNMQMPVENLQPPVPAAPPPATVASATDTPNASVSTPADTDTPSTPTAEDIEAPPETAASVAPPAAAKPATPPAAAPLVTVTTKPAAPVFNAREISDLLAAEQGVPTKYVVQLGVFQTEVAANRLRNAVASVGFPVAVVKVKQGNHRSYAVQQGPFDTAALAKATQQRLAKRGIISVIQKA